jgi:tetratricopeptide (TPR) repeat protein
LNINGDFNTSLADLGVVSRFAGTLAYVDSSRLAAMGHSYGAQAALAWRAQPDSPVNAVVFIDSTLEYLGLESPLVENARRMIAVNRKSAVPLILFADRLKHPKLDTLDSYVSFASRYESLVDNQDHNDFISQGTIGESLLAGISGDARKAEAARRNFDRIAVRILQFLDAYVKRDAGSLQALQSAGARYKAPQPEEPTGRQLARIFLRDGEEQTRQFLAGFASMDPDVYEGAALVLSEEGHKPDSLTMLRIGVQRTPGSRSLQQALGEALEAAGDTAGAVAAYRKALALLPKDSTVPDLIRLGLRQQLEGRLKALRR